MFESGNELAIWAINGPGQAPENYTRYVAEQVSDRNLHFCQINLFVGSFRVSTFNLLNEGSQDLR